jgi:hypothetical protein
MADVYNRTTPYAPTLQQRSGSAPGVADTIRHTASDVMDAAGQMKEKVQDAASTVAHRVEDAWDSASSGIRQGARAVADTADDFWTGTTRLIRRYPVASVLIAFGAGYLCATLCSSVNWTDDVAGRMSRASA